MRKLVLLVLWVVISFSGYSQSQKNRYYFPRAFEKGDLVVNAGISIGYHREIRQQNSFRTGIIPPFPVFIEYGITNAISIGAYGSYFQRQFRYDRGENNELFKVHYGYIGGRASLHFAPFLEERVFRNLDSDHLDVYVSATGGTLRRQTIHYFEIEDNDPFIGGALGLRYFFTEHFGLFGEAGYMPFEVATIGLSGRF